MASSSLSTSLQETLALFDSAGTPQTTSEIAQHLDIGRRSTYNRLNRLVEKGWLETKKVGGNGRVWWRPLDGTTPGTPDWDGATGSLVDVLDGADIGVFVLDENFDVARINDATEQYFGIDRKRVLGRDKRHLVEERVAPRIEDSTTFAETVLATYDDNTDRERFECHVTAGNEREERWLEHRSHPIETGAFAGGRVELYYDITERHRSEQARREESKQFEQLVDAVEEYAIFTLDSEGYIQTWNAGAERIKGYERAEILGEHFSTFYTKDDREASVPERNLSKAASQGSVEDEGWRVRADGSRFWANVTITAIYDEEGDLNGYAKVTRDMTERREYEQTLEEQAERLEGQRDELESELEEIFERIDDAFYALDHEFRFDYVNDTAASYFGISEGELLGKNIWEALDVNEDNPIIEKFETALTTQEPTSFEQYLEPLEIWAAVEVYPSATGLSVYFRDITEQQERERELEESELRYRTLVENFPDGVVGLFDEEFTYTAVGGELVDQLGLDRTDRIGYSISEIYPDDIVVEVEPHFEAALAGDSRSFEVEFHDRHLSAQTLPVRNADGEVFAGMLVVQDITERKERERQLEQYETIIESLNEGVYVVDADRTFTWVNESYAEMLGYSREELIGEPVTKIVASDVIREMEVIEQKQGPEHLQRMDVELVTASGNRIVVDAASTMLPGDETSDWYRAGVVRDITERKRRERELEESRRRYRTLVENFPNGAVALVDEDLRYVTVGGQPLKKADTTIDELKGTSLREAVPAEIADLLAPHYEAALDGESRTFVSEIGENIYQFHITPVRDDDDDIFAALGMSQDVTQARERKQELERQREELAALNNINDIVHDITDAVIEQSTREEIERAVCEGLANSDSYTFAWIGEVDLQTESVHPRMEVGTDGYLEEIAPSTDPDETAGQGPAGTAIRTGEMQVLTDISTNSEFESLQELAEDYGFQSLAAIPITHEDSLYGLLGIYSERANAFDQAEREVIGQLGEVVGHAIAATNRKQALMSDEVIELEFRIQNLFDTLEIDTATDGRITLDHMIPIKDDEFLVYGTASADAVESLKAIVEAVPHWMGMTFREGHGETSFELRLSEPPVLSKVATLGGSVEKTVIEDGDYQMTIHLAPNTDVRQVIETVETVYPSAEMVKRHQTKRQHTMPSRERNEIVAELTDRQCTALETAIYSGYFEWPRNASAEDVAESLGIAPPTFHQHLRKAQKNIFESLFSTSDSATGV